MPCAQNDEHRLCLGAYIVHFLVCCSGTHVSCGSIRELTGHLLRGLHWVLNDTSLSPGQKGLLPRVTLKETKKVLNRVWSQKKSPESVDTQIFLGDFGASE